MEVIKLLKYFLFLLAVNSSIASDEIETHPNLPLLPEDCGAIDEDRIISDRPHFEEFPWLTLLNLKIANKDTRFLCDGTLINSKYVLTVAHCVRAGDVDGVRIGDYNIETDPDCEGFDSERICASPYQDIDVEEIVVHPEYESKFSKNDIALIRLKKSVNFDDSNFGAICLPTTSDLRGRDLRNASGTLAGWKLLKNPSHLLKAHATIYSDEQCSKHYKGPEITQWLPNKLCAKGFPYLESGAPLMIKSDFTNHQKYVQYGILSSGSKSGDIGHYIDVRKHMKWILDTIKP